MVEKKGTILGCTIVSEKDQMTNNLPINVIIGIEACQKV